MPTSARCTEAIIKAALFDPRTRYYQVYQMVTSAQHGSRRLAPHRRLSAVERRALIEDAAARLFAERGYGATTVEDIVAEAGVSKPMLYRMARGVLLTVR